MELLTLTSLLLAVGYSLAELTQLPNCGISRPTARIVNGERTKHGEHPWMVAIYQYVNQTWKFICGGSVLNENWIISAAHCFEDPPEEYEVYLGLHSVLKKTDPAVQKRQLSEIILHEMYNNETLTCDVALLKTDTKIDIAGSDGYVNAICLPTENSRPTGEATVLGWGKLFGDDNKVPATLQKATVPIVSDEACAKKYEDDYSDFNYIQVVPHMLCAGGEGKDSCQYDSGGPLFQTDQETGVSTLVGIVSGGADCAYEDYPGLYMRVSSFLEWIGQHMTSPETR